MEVMEVEKMPYKDAKKRREKDEEYKRENTRLIVMRMHNKYDADILSVAGAAESIQGELKRLIRLGIQYDKILNEQKTE
jgi:hypothetical protein